ncbi:MAG: hypothetical protein M0Z51_09365 [Propionibacterium sp.]|nr:hypothetical protein [Propionibacterium sp.]
MSTQPCADRCSIVADLAVQLAHATGTQERVARVSLGLTPVYVPVSARFVCEGCGHVWESREAADACATYDDTTD